MMFDGHMRNYVKFSQALFCVLIFLSLLFSTLAYQVVKFEVQLH